jgi:outer membrane protein insertion porin family
MVRQFLRAVWVLLLSANAWAFDPFIVKDIRVEGIQRIEAGTVFSYLPVKVGESFTDEKATQAIRALFATGFFRDVRIEVENNVLIVVLEERPAIASIGFTGMKEFEPDAVRKSMRESSLQEGRVFDRALVDQAEQEIKRQYLSKGKYGVTITTTVTPLERNRVAINFAIDEGDIARIKQINIVGNKVFSEAVLLDQFVLRTPGWLTWYTKNDQYSRQKLQGDIESLRSYYLNRGYLDFNVESTQVSITPDRQDIYITVNISEGERYTVTDVKLGGDTIIPAAQLTPLIQLAAGQAFSREKLNESTKKITDRLGSEGYAFANANAVPEVDRANRTVSFTILVDPGRRVYVRRINVVGNTRTRDEVVRRELRQLEGAFYDASKINLSKERVDRTQYFSEVDVDTTPVTGSSDQIDVTLKVKEKPTGALLVGVGLSSAEGLVFQGSVAQSNFLGSGDTVGASFNTGKINQNIALSYTNPYYNVDGLSRGFEVYKRRTNASTLNIGNYTTSSVGGGVNFGYPLGEQESIFFGLSGDRTSLTLNTNSPQRLLNFARQFGSKYTSGTGTIGWAIDSRDSALWTTKGQVQKASLEVTPFGDLSYYKYTYSAQWYHSFTRDLTLMLRGEIATADGFNNKQLPFFKNYYGGGIGSVRGYRTASLGPKDPIDGSVIGGDRRLIGNAEMLFPMPGAGLDKSLRWAAFVDAGQVYGAGQKMALADLRYTTGLALSWISPMGPLRISLAFGLNQKPGDSIQRAQFTMGQVF